MKLKINKACDLASISVLPPRRPRGSGGVGGTSASASAAAGAAASQQRSQSMSQQSFSQGGGAPFSQGGGASFSQGGGASFSQGRGGSGALFSQGSGGGGASFSQGRGGNGAPFSQGSGGGGAAFSQVSGGGAALSQVGGGGAAFSQGGGVGGAAFCQGGGGGGAAFSQGGGGAGAPFSQGGGDGGAASFSQEGGSASLLHSQSQISQASLDENLLGLLRPSPARDQRFTLHDDSSKRMPSFPANSASCVREESQLQLAKIPSNPTHRWNPCLSDSKCQVNEDVERKFQHVASSVHKMGMVLDSVQNDVMQLNRAMKEASLDSGSIQTKFVLIENSLQQILKGQDDLKALLLDSTKSNPDQISVLNCHTSKLDEISLTLSVLKQVQEELRQLKGDIFRIFTKEMEGIVRAISSLNSRPDATQMLADQSCTSNTKLLMNQTPVANQSPLMNQRPVSDGRPKMNQTPVANGRPQKKQKTVPKRKPQMKQAPVANGRPQRTKRQQKKQTPVANARPQKKQTPVPKGKPQMKPTAVANGQAQVAYGNSKMNQVPEANVKPLMKQIAAAKDVPGVQVYGRKVEGVKLVEEAKVVKAGARKVVASSCCMVAPKQEELGFQKADPQAPTKKAPFSLLIDLDDEEGSDGGNSWVILKTIPGRAADLPIVSHVRRGGELLTNGEEVSEDALEILRRARKRRRREATQAIVLVHQ